MRDCFDSIQIYVPSIYTKKDSDTVLIIPRKIPQKAELETQKKIVKQDLKHNVSETKKAKPATT